MHLFAAHISPSRNGISAVLFWGAGVKMAWLHTRWVIARMASVLAALHRSSIQCKSQLCGAILFACIREQCISVLILYPCPLPAAIGLLKMTPELDVNRVPLRRRLFRPRLAKALSAAVFCFRPIATSAPVVPKERLAARGTGFRWCISVFVVALTRRFVCHDVTPADTALIQAIALRRSASLRRTRRARLIS